MPVPLPSMSETMMGLKTDVMMLSALLMLTDLSLVKTIAMASTIAMESSMAKRLLHSVIRLAHSTMKAASMV